MDIKKNGNYLNFIKAAEILIDLNIKKFDDRNLTILNGTKSKIDYFDIDKLLIKAKEGLDNPRALLGGRKQHLRKYYKLIEEKENINSNSTYGIEYRPYRIEAGRQKFEIRHLNYNRKRKIGIMKCGSFSVYIYKNGKEILDFHKRKDVRVIMSKNVNYKIIIENHSKEAIDFELIID